MHKNFPALKNKRITIPFIKKLQNYTNRFQRANIDAHLIVCYE